MLIEYYGKSPHKSEFISSDRSLVLQLLTVWIESGQNHLGESMLHAQNYGVSTYFFTINKPILDSMIAGIFLKSHDRKLRRYPFVMFHQYTEGDLGDVVPSYHALLDELGFEMSTFVQTMDNLQLLNQYLSFLQSCTAFAKGAFWQHLCDGRVLASDNLTAVLYRKLMTGDFS